MSELIGYLLTIDAIITWGLASLVYKSGLGRTEPKATLFFRLCCVTFFTGMVSLIFGNYQFFLKINESQLIVYLISCFISGVSVTIGDLLYFISLKKIDASRAYPLTQLSLIFVYPFAFIFFGEELTISILIGGLLILSSVFLLSKKDTNNKENINENYEVNNSEKEPSIFIGVVCAIGTAFFWAIAIVSFYQARIISGDVFVTNFMRLFPAAILVAILGLFQKDYYSGFKKENRESIRYYGYIAIAGSLSLGLADSLYYEAAAINGLVLTSTFTANTPMIQLFFSILILKEKFRKRFLIAVCLIIVGNYIILFL
jgi:drug/metabolite transporter (DMT)-like permease